MSWAVEYTCLRCFGVGWAEVGGWAEVAGECPVGWRGVPDERGVWSLVCGGCVTRHDLALMELLTLRRRVE